MVVRLSVSYATAGLVAMGLGVAFPGEAFAQANVLKECGSQYQAAKAANELAGQSWQDFLKACRTKLQEQGAAPAAETKPAEAKPAETKPAEAKPAEKPVETKPAEAAPPPPAAEAPKPLTPPAAETAPAAKPKSAQVALRERQKACAAEWKAKKKELMAADKKITWPKFWSACNKRLKDAGE